MLDKLRESPALASVPTDGGAAYGTAMRHSARVRRLKIILPVAALLISMIFIGVSLIKAWWPADVSVESATIENGKIVMEKPAVAGRNDDGIAYSMTADRALQDIASPNLMTLENVLAAVPMNDIVAKVTASGGVFDRNTNKMQMTAPFEINMTNGIKAKFQSADVDLRAGKMQTSEPVDITTKDGSIVAQSMQIADNGRTIIFSGQVRARLAASTIQQAEN
jgi:lipopolysaccharide export system protein LptC